jgi:hypothetical protein
LFVAQIFPLRFNALLTIALDFLLLWSESPLSIDLYFLLLRPQTPLAVDL